jgi:NTP pyrophosphatase (non-canonical NTP hydrolase)
VNFSEYQRAALRTNIFHPTGPQAATVPLLGLAGETGSILNVYKKFLLDKSDIASQNAFLSEELGDLLWYLSAVASALGLDLEAIAAENLKKASDRYEVIGEDSQLKSFPIFDAKYKEHEKFPRKFVVRLVQREEPDGHLSASMYVLHADPFVFSNRPFEADGKPVGFRLGEQIGASLTDKSRREDGYRFHDAIHLGFMAVLGWSPVIRDSMHLRRKSCPETYAYEDGPRAFFAEEGLSAVLAGLAERRSGFQSEISVDSDAISMMKAATENLEAARLPAWLWRKAICQGFQAMHQLHENGGGVLIADLDARTLVFRKDWT